MEENLKQIASWFFNTVYITENNSTVIKIQKKTNSIIWTTKRRLEEALEIHKKYLWNAIPNTEIETDISSPRWYFVKQEFCTWRLLSLLDLDNSTIKAKFDTLVKAWKLMETDKKLFFDIYWWNGLIKNKREFFKKKPNFIFTNLILTPDNEIKFVDIDYLPMSNPLVRCWKTIRNFTNLLYTWNFWL